MYIYQLFYDKGDKNIQCGNHNPFNKWYWGNWTATCKRMKFDNIHKNELKWIKDLNIRSYTIELLEEKDSQ